MFGISCYKNGIRNASGSMNMNTIVGTFFTKLGSKAISKWEGKSKVFRDWIWQIFFWSITEFAYQRLYAREGKVTKK